MKVVGFLKTSMIDYPNTLASVVYTPKCNFNCEFCHNKDLVYEEMIPVEHTTIFKHLDKRQGIIDGVVITGGEPTLQKNIVPFIKALKAKGLKVKLDTNGHKPEILKALLDNQLLDYVAMDIKNSWAKYDMTAQSNVSAHKIRESIDLLKNSVIDYEFRTTLIKEFHTIEDIQSIGKIVHKSKRFVFQQYDYSDKQIKNQKFNFFTMEEMTRFKEEIAVQYSIDEIIVRGRY